MLCFVGYALLMPCFWTRQFIFYDIFSKHHIPALDIARCANDVAGGTVYILMALLWHTLCYQNDQVHNFWKSSRKWVPSIMAGGFIPRPAAASMCLLLFVSANIIAQKIVPGPGSNLNKHGWDGPLDIYDGCRADSLEVDTYGGFGPVPKSWFQRLWRGKPFGCYKVKEQNIFGLSFGAGAWAEAFYDLDTPYIDGSDTVREIPVNLEHPNADSMWKPLNNSTAICAYQCAKYSAVSFSGLISSVGGIFCGAAVVVTVSDWFSTKVGWTLIEKMTEPAVLLRAVRGIELPKDEKDLGLSEDEVVKNGEKHMDGGKHPGSKTFCALQLMAIMGLSSLLAPRLTIDGYFTVDYYTTFTLLFSLLCTTVLRLWNPYTGRAIIYTKNLWLHGRDTFLVYQPPEDHKPKESAQQDDKTDIEQAKEKAGKWVTREYDLYQWINLTNTTRARLLLAYCRTLSDEQLAATWPEKKDEPDHEEKKTDGTGFCTTDCLCGILSHTCNILSFRCPTQDNKEEAEETIQAVALSGFTVEVKGYAPHTPLHKVLKGAEAQEDVEIELPEKQFDIDEKFEFKDNLFDSTSSFVHIVGLTEGTVTGKGKADGEVMFEFDPTKEENNQGHYRWHNDNFRMTQFGTKKIKLSVPMEKLIEKSKQWTFIRAAFGEKSLKETVRAEQAAMRRVSSNGE